MIALSFSFAVAVSFTRSIELCMKRSARAFFKVGACAWLLKRPCVALAASRQGAWRGRITVVDASRCCLAAVACFEKFKQFDSRFAGHI